jgi:Fur family ferric uptake transcriptional regulator
MKPQEVLHDHDLKRTACREGILSVMLESGHALSENEIKDELSGNFDRTTFYRSFKTLLEKHIIHKIVVDNQLVKYALDNSVTKKQNHAHFYCLECDSTICLDSIALDEPQIPEGFEASETEVIIKGLCNNCKLSKK